MVKVCETCNKSFKTYRNRRRFCSIYCSNTHPAKIASKMGDLNVSKRPEVRKKMSFAKKGRKGAEIHNWKGDDAGSPAIHAWVVRELGRPIFCFICHTTEDRAYHWANVNGHDYRRNLDDWIRLCASCHTIFDGHARQNALKAWKTRRERYGPSGYKR